MGLRRRPCVHPCVRTLTLSNINISETSELVAIKFYLKHQLGKGKDALGFGSDRIRTVVFMATYSSYRAITGKTVSHLLLSLIGSFSIAGNNDRHTSLDEFQIRPDPITDYGVSCH